MLNNSASTNNLSVEVWEERVVIPTYNIGMADKNPMFFEKRVYQGSSGVVYPNPVVEKIADDKQDNEYHGLFLENKYLKILILPELGGRVQMAYDKIKERHFIYYNRVIKPALVGLTGPWISGGIEFNWPQHHRPSTFDPIDYTIEKHADGSKTVWVNEVEKMFRTKGMAGFTLHPGKAYLEIKARLFNRTSLPQTFLWWANPAVKVNDDYQSVFPPDVNAVFDHGKRDVSSFPIATGTYYKVDYSPGTDISRYKNIPVPTSYMAINSEYDFVGGYEHDTKAGVLHVANHHVSPGKKQWTWGNSDFGKAWDRNLTDEDGPYIELMTGVYTDNQPDFSWLMPYEEKSFTQYFLPYRELGLVKNATKDILVNIDIINSEVILKVFVTSQQRSNRLELSIGEQLLFQETADMRPEEVFERAIAFPLGRGQDEDLNPISRIESKLLITIYDSAGKLLIHYDASKNKNNRMPEPAQPARLPQEIDSTEQLFLNGQHLEQYRHATYSPVSYYEEALRLDPLDLRNNNALGVWLLRRGQFERSEPYFRTAIETITRRNPNPYDSEPYYNLGLSLKFQERVEEAYDVFYKASWTNASRHAAYFSLSQIDTARSEFGLALEHIEDALDSNARNGKARHLKGVILRKLEQFEDALSTNAESMRRDPFNLGSLFENVLIYRQLKNDSQAEAYLRLFLALSRKDPHNLIEYALDYAAAGLYPEAMEILTLTGPAESSAMIYYYLGFFAGKLDLKAEMKDYLQKAQSADSYLCFPNRLEDILALQFAIDRNPRDAKAPYYLGNLWYDKRQYTDAITNWELSLIRDDTFPTVHRNLGIASYNKLNDPCRALTYFEKAFSLDRTDARVFMELHQLYKRLNVSPGERLLFLESNLDICLERDDVYLERIALYNFTGQNQIACDLIMERKFHPWEGGEGMVSGQFVYSLVELAKEDLKLGKAEAAIEKLQRAQDYPHNLGEGKLFGARENDIHYWMGCAYEALRDLQQAEEFFTKATIGLSVPGAAIFYNDQQPDKILYQGLAWQKLGDGVKAVEIFRDLIRYGEVHANDEAGIEYFAVSLPNLLVFDDDLVLRNKIHCAYVAGLGFFGMSNFGKAAEAFRRVLEMDPSHLGAKQHKIMIPDYFGGGGG